LATLPPNKSANVRSVLEYVPYFRDKIFAVHVERPLVDSRELVDALLDLDVLQEIGVRPVLIVEGADASALYEHTRVCEMRSALVEAPLKGGQLVRERVREILGRHQIPVVASGRSGSFDPESVHMAFSLGASKYIALLNDHKVPSLDGRPIAAILESEVAGLAGNVTHRELLDQAAEACRAGIPRVHLLDGKMRGVLVEELFSEEGVGTMVHTDSYREIRPLKEEDIPELLSMIARSVVDSKLVNRNSPRNTTVRNWAACISSTAMKAAATAAHYVNSPKGKRRKWAWTSSSPSPKAPSITSGIACITRNFPATACLRNVCAPWNSAVANPGFLG